MGRFKHVITFFCSACGEELEAEDSIRGSRMTCPACGKEIDVPRTGSRSAPPRADVQRGARLILLVLLLGLFGLLVVGGAGYALLKRERERRATAVPKCATCEGSGKTRDGFQCAACGGRGRLDDRR